MSNADRLPLPIIEVENEQGVVVGGGPGRLRRDPCDCTHNEGHHDPITGACLYTNPTLGPCPCASTPQETRRALQAVHDTIKKTLREQGR